MQLACKSCCYPITKHYNWLSVRHLCYTCQLFFRKCVRVVVSTEPEFLKINRWIPKIAKDFQRSLKIAKDFLTTCEDNRRCRNTFYDLKTGPTIFKEFLPKIRNFSPLLFKQLHYCQWGMRNWSKCVILF